MFFRPALPVAVGISLLFHRGGQLFRGLTRRRRRRRGRRQRGVGGRGAAAAAAAAAAVGTRLLLLLGGIVGSLSVQETSGSVQCSFWK